MIAAALLGTLLIYAFGVLLLVRRTEGYCAADLGFIFLSLCFLYTAVPAVTFLFLDLDGVPGWPWIELSRLAPTEDALAEHLWRHNLFLGLFFFSYVFARGRVKIGDFRQGVRKLQSEVSWRELGIFATLFCAASIINVSLIGDVDVYAEKYLAIESLGLRERIIVVVANRIAAGIQYFMIVAFALLPMRNWFRLSGILMLVAIQSLMSSGSRIELLFVILGCGVAYALFVHQIKLRYVFFAGVVAIGAFWFIEVFRYYEYNLAATFSHFHEFGFKPMGELGAVFSTGFHLYSLSEMGQLPPLDGRVFFFEVLSLFSSNSSADYSPQYWYWREFYPDYLVPPQTNGPISDSALWGLGVVDLGVRACFVGVMFGWISGRVFRREPSFMLVVVYVFYCATCVMTLKYGVLWQLNPLVKTMVPLMGVYYFYRLIVLGRCSGANNIRI